MPVNPPDFEAHCQGKQGFKSFELADQIARRRRRSRRKAPVKVYRCQICGDFHLGKSSPK